MEIADLVEISFRSEQKAGEVRQRLLAAQILEDEAAGPHQVVASEFELNDSSKKAQNHVHSSSLPALVQSR